MTVENVNTRVEIFPDHPSETNAFLDRAYEYLSDMKSYSEHMSDVIDVQVERTSADEGTAFWNTKIENAEFNWTQQNVYDAENRTVRFKLLDGDFSMMTGEWKIDEDDNHFFLCLDLEYEVGLPVIEDILGPILKKKMQTNALNMLKNLKTWIEGDDNE